MEYIKEIDECFTLSRAETEDLYNFVKFSILTNYHNYNLNINTFKLKYDLNVNYNKELALFDNAVYYAILADGDIWGTIRTVRWDHTTELPLEEIYRISAIDVLKAYNSDKIIWHMGRFAIANKARHSLGSQLFKMLLMYAILPICQNPNSIVLAECDTRLHRIINKLGIKTKTLANPVMYLGSKTVPILSEGNDLLLFFNKNINLL